MRDTLIITDQAITAPVSASTAYEYRVDGGHILGDGTKLLNDANRLNELGATLAKTYTDAIARLRLEMPWQALNDDMLGHLFYFTELNTKRSEMNQSYDAFVNAELLREKLSNVTIKTVYLFGSSLFNDDTLTSIFPNAQIIRDHSPAKTSLRSIFVKNTYFFYRFWIIALLRWLLPKVKPADLQANRFFMTRFPGRLSIDEVEDKYSDLVQNNDRYIAGILTDGMQQNISISRWLQISKRSRQLRQTVFYDRYHHVADGIAGFFWMFALMANVARNKPDFRINGINLTDIIQDEAVHSLYRLPRLIAVSRGIKRLYAQILSDTSSTKSIVYYLHEYGYGRMFSSLLERHFPNFKRIGMQHGPASIRKMVYWLSPDEINDKNHPLALPHAVLAEDAASAALYRKMGYHHVMVMKKAPRLRGSFAKTIKLKEDRTDLPHLIATGLHDSAMMIAMMQPIIEKNLTRNYLIKFHPKAIVDDDILSSLPKNCAVVTDNIDILFQKVGKVYVTYSSVGVEAEEIGLDVAYMDIPARVSERPKD